MENKKITAKLIAIQNELAIPKSHNAGVGRRTFQYRNLADIHQAIKPLALKYGVSFVTTTKLITMGQTTVTTPEGQTITPCIYIEATATATDRETGETVSAVGYAREDINTAHMAPSQATGSAASYARKYAYESLLALDETAADDDERAGQASTSAPAQPQRQAQPQNNFQNSGFGGMNLPPL